jgi:hypothetical protein
VGRGHLPEPLDELPRKHISSIANIGQPNDPTVEAIAELISGVRWLR